MRLLASGLSKVGVVQLLDGRVLVRLADGIILVGIIEHFRSQGADIHGVAHISRSLRLSAAVDTSAGADP